jgi:hypothetical protein
MWLKVQGSRIQNSEPSFKTLASWLWDQNQGSSLPKLGSQISEFGSGKVAGKVLIVDQYPEHANILILLETVLKWCCE